MQNSHKTKSRNKVAAWTLSLAAAGMISVSLTPDAIAQSNAVLVLDSSGSMAGRIGGIRKIDIARRAVGDILVALDPKTKLGVIAYGHRRKGDCTDIQMIQNVAVPNRSSLNRAINALRPIGKTPIGDSVRMAAHSLRYTENKATVILVSDGKATCGSDPCALGRELKANGIDFKVHVVGFNIRRGEESGLQCLARNTGGLYVAANNARTLKKALTVAVKKVEAPPPPPVAVKAPPSRVVVQAPPPAPAAAALPNGLKIRAFVAKGGAQWKGQIGVTLWSKPEGLAGKRKKIAGAWRVKSGYIFKRLKPGNYQVRFTLADHRHINHVSNIEYSGGGKIHDIVLNIGRVRFDVTYKQGGRPLDWQLGWTVLDTKTDFAGKRKKIASFWRVKSGYINWLPAGTWRLDGLVADARYMRLRTKITIKAGETHIYSQNMNAGLVRFDARLSRESKIFPGQLAWTIYTGKKDLGGKRQKLTNFWRVQAKKIFMLPAGEWDVAGLLPDARHVKFNTRVKVEAGGQIPHEVILNAAKIRFDVSVDGAPSKEQIGLTIFDPKKDLAGKQKKIASFWRVKSGYINFLSAGQYTMIGLLADQRKVIGNKNFQIIAGEEKPVSIDLRVQ